MTDNLSMSVPNAESAFHLFTAACYLLPLFGAWLADNVLGKYRVVLYLSAFYCLGLLRAGSCLGPFLSPCAAWRTVNRWQAIIDVNASYMWHREQFIIVKS